MFQDADPLELRDHAETLLRYIETRHLQTVKASEKIFTQALDGLQDTPKRIILTEGSYYDWTSGPQLESLDNVGGTKPYEEVWFDPSSSDLALDNVDFRSYMWSRSGYFIDAFFQVCSQVADPVARAATSLSRYEADEIKGLLRLRLGQALGATMGGAAALAGLPELKRTEVKSSRIGMIGVALTREIGEKIIENIRIVKTTHMKGGGVKGKTQLQMSDLMELFGSQRLEED